MLIKVRADLADFPAEVVGSLVEEEALHARFESALLASSNSASSGIKMDAVAFGGSLLVGVVVDRVIASTLTRLAVSRGLLGLGAGSAAETFGVGLVVMVGVDWIIGKVTDPAGKIANEVCGSLEELKRALCEGDGKGSGLRLELAAASRERSTLQKEALRQTILAHR